jgi:hypothetical protein
MLDQNRRAEIGTGADHVPARKRRVSRRTKDFLFLVGVVDLAAMAMFRMMPGLITMAYMLGAIVFFDVVLAVMLFGMMDDY